MKSMLVELLKSESEVDNTVSSAHKLTSPPTTAKSKTLRRHASLGLPPTEQTCTKAESFWPSSPSSLLLARAKTSSPLQQQDSLALRQCDAYLINGDYGSLDSSSCSPSLSLSPAAAADMQCTLVEKKDEHDKEKKSDMNWNISKSKNQTKQNEEKISLKKKCTLLLAAVSLAPVELSWCVGEALIVPFLMSLGCPVWLTTFCWLPTPVLDTVLQPFYGKWSDRLAQQQQQQQQSEARASVGCCVRKLGPRKPFLLAFSLFASLGLLLTPFAPALTAGLGSTWLTVALALAGFFAS